MAEEKKKNRVAFVKTISTKYGPMEKVSLELNEIGQVAVKDGKVYLILDAKHKALNVYEKDGQASRYFLNFNLNRYASMSLDEYEKQEGNSGNQGGGDDVDDLPF